MSSDTPLKATIITVTPESLLQLQTSLLEAPIINAITVNTETINVSRGSIHLDADSKIVFGLDLTNAATKAATSKSGMQTSYSLDGGNGGGLTKGSTEWVVSKRTAVPHSFNVAWEEEEAGGGQYLVFYIDGQRVVALKNGTGI